VKKLLLIAAALVLSVTAYVAVFSACTPVTAYISGVADDSATIYINGTEVATFTYIDKTATTMPPIYTFDPALLFYDGSDNYIAFKNVNSAVSQILSAWWISVECASGENVFITSNDGGYDMYNDPTGVNVPPADWMDPSFTDPTNLFTGTGQQVAIPGAYWAKNLIDPRTGQEMNMISYNTTGATSDPNQIIYYGKHLTLTTVDSPESFLYISKTASPSTNITWNQCVMFTVTICNSGAPIYSPVTLTDVHNANLGGVCVNPSSSGYANPHFSYSGLNMTYDSFGGRNLVTGVDFCDTVTYGLYAIGFPENCQVLANTVTARFVTLAGTTMTATAVATALEACPPTNTPTRTFTNTNTHTPTNSHTPTNTPSPTQTPTVFAQVTKSINKNVVMLGEVITYCFDYTNSTGAPVSFQLWDTLPAVTDYVGCSGGCTTSGSTPNFIVSWSINVAAGGSAHVCTWVRVARMPWFDPLFEYFTMAKEESFVFDYSVTKAAALSGGAIKSEICAMTKAGFYSADYTFH
jgi:uncharacterized repeat protein (TIGR01451 family)